MGVLKTTTHEFTLHAGPEGTLYTVRDGSGKTIVREVSGAVLAAEFPQLNEDLKGLYAGNQILQSTFRAADPGKNRINSFRAEPVELQSDSVDLPSLPDLKDRQK